MLMMSKVMMVGLFYSIKMMINIIINHLLGECNGKNHLDLLYVWDVIANFLV